MKIALTAESTIDLPQELLKKYKIKTIPFFINLGEESFEDCEGISQKIYDYVEKTKNLPTTSAINPSGYIDFFNKIKEEYDEIIHISLSSGLSSSYNNAKNAANEVSGVYVVDSKQLSTGIALLAIQAREWIDGGLEACDVADLLEQKVPEIKTSFILENIHYMHMGGRCSSLAMFGANLLKIKPQIAINEGILSMKGKFMGTLDKVIDKYADAVFINCPTLNLERVFITHSSPMPKIVEKLKEKLKKRGFKEIIDTYANGTICSHCGPGCVGILFDGGENYERSD